MQCTSMEKKYVAFNDILDDAIYQFEGFGPDQDEIQLEEKRRRCANDLSRILYNTRRDRKEFDDSVRRLREKGMHVNLDAFDPRVYKSLVFPSIEDE